MTNSERLQQNNTKIQDIIDKANALPDAGGGDGEIDKLISGTITEINSNADTIISYAFYSISTLVSAYFPQATSIGTSGFHLCTGLVSAKFDKVGSITTYGLRGCTKLKIVEFGAITNIGVNVFLDSSSLETVIIRTTSKICALSNTNSFNGTPIASGTGYVYVPRMWLSDDDSKKDYRRTNNWSTYASQFRALEDYTVDGTITGALDPTKI